MKFSKILSILFASLLVASCQDSSTLDEKKDELEAKKAEMATLKTSISQLEQDIADLDQQP